ncbi:MAG: glycosyltransferase family 9 protein [Bryobacterales bacterium]|nr:glycosyltransferase family 9 protein [Bryobacterales bacterium]
MGDIIHALPAVATLKQNFPQAELWWAVEPKWAALLEGNPFVDRILLVDRSWQGLAGTLSRLRAQRFEWAVDFQGLVKSALVASVARTERIFGFHRSQVRERPAALFYSTQVHARSAHVVDRNLELAAATGASTIVHAFPIPPGRPEGELPEGAFVLANPLAGWAAKQWPLEYYGALARLLRRHWGLPLVVNGPPEAKPVLEQIPESWVHVSGLPGLLDATRRAAAVVGIDSGPIHLAAALGKPGVAIFGPTDPARNGPYGDSVTVLRAAEAKTCYQRGRREDDSMRAVAPETVFEALAARLAVRSQSAGSGS